jgi:hypothetical protein
MSFIYNLNDIHMSDKLIILYVNKKIIRLWYYNVKELLNFILCVLNRNKYNPGIVAHLKINNKKNKPTSYITLVYSNYYEYIDGQCIETLLTKSKAHNNTITLFNNKKKIIFHPNDDLLSLLYMLLIDNWHINRRILLLLNTPPLL